MTPANTNDIDRYISDFPANTQVILEQLRDTIRIIVPEAEESINYGIPANGLGTVKTDNCGKPVRLTKNANRVCGKDTTKTARYRTKANFRTTKKPEFEKFTTLMET